MAVLKYEVERTESGGAVRIEFSRMDLAIAFMRGILAELRPDLIAPFEVAIADLDEKWKSEKLNG